MLFRDPSDLPQFFLVEHFPDRVVRRVDPDLFRLGRDRLPQLVKVDLPLARRHIRGRSAFGGSDRHVYGRTSVESDLRDVLIEETVDELNRESAFEGSCWNEVNENHGSKMMTSSPGRVKALAKAYMPASLSVLRFERSKIQTDPRSLPRSPGSRYSGRVPVRA